jgi:hypothetical protein
MLVDDLECVNEQLYFNALAFENIPIEKEVNNDEEVDWTSLCLELEEYIMYYHYSLPNPPFSHLPECSLIGIWLRVIVLMHRFIIKVLIVKLYLKQ